MGCSSSKPYYIITVYELILISKQIESTIRTKRDKLFWNLILTSYPEYVNFTVKKNDIKKIVNCCTDVCISCTIGQSLEFTGKIYTAEVGMHSDMYNNMMSLYNGKRCEQCDEIFCSCFIGKQETEPPKYHA